MNDEEYKALFEERLNAFRKPGEPLCISGRFQSDPSSKYKCDLCDWPITSNKTEQKGLKYVNVLENLATGKQIFIGSECARRCWRYIVKSEPEFKIENMELVNHPTDCSEDEVFEDDWNLDDIPGDMIENDPEEMFIDGLEIEYYEALEEHNQEIATEVMNEIYSEENFYEMLGEDDYVDKNSVD